MISGKDTAACLDLPWERLSPISQALHEGLAEQLNERYLAPLQRLVQDYYDAALIGKQMEDPSENDSRSYEEMMNGLLERTETLLGKQLLREEQKVSV